MPATKRNSPIVKEPSQLQSAKPIENRILASLPADEYSRVLRNLEAVHLKKGTVLYHAKDRVTDCYFPSSGMLSLLSTTEKGETVEVAMVGKEGMIGVPAVLQMNVTPYEVMVQIESKAMRIKVDLIKKEFSQEGRLQTLLLRYTHSLLCQISQSAVCNSFHTVKQRLCRWLLICRDKSQSDTFSLTQEFISQMLGTPRTNVTMTLNSLQQLGLINYRRGLITILDWQRAAQYSCECYRVVKKEIDGFYQ